MKQIYLVRHAKSSWDDISIPDFERPLNDRGKHDAPEMARRLLKKKIAIDQFISSPAKRAKRTAGIFLEEYGKHKKDLALVPELYLAGPSIFRQVIAKLDDQYDAVAIFAHNPGITDYANSLTDARLDNMPTCSIFGAKASIQSWKEWDEAGKEFIFFDYPKSKDH